MAEEAGVSMFLPERGFAKTAFRSSRIDRKIMTEKLGLTEEKEAMTKESSIFETDEDIINRINGEIATIDRDMVIVKRIQEKFAGILKDVDELTIGGVLVLENSIPGDLYRNYIEKHLKNSQNAEKLLIAEREKNVKALTDFKKHLNKVKAQS
ncbi:hypothetical protein [Succinimonas sp.]|uniref:hypothetical protein n=1 Tax=Succinimonas sp. TaxID=1936151 RepID=UPI0038688DD9